MFSLNFTSALSRWVTQLCCFLFFQIGDFGMSRDLADQNYYFSRGGEIPVKWTAPEVGYYRCVEMRSEALLLLIYFMVRSICTNGPQLLFKAGPNLSKKSRHEVFRVLSILHVAPEASLHCNNASYFSILAGPVQTKNSYNGACQSHASRRKVSEKKAGTLR